MSNFNKKSLIFLTTFAASVFFAGCEKIDKIDELASKVEAQERIINEQQNKLEEQQKNKNIIWIVLGGILFVIVSIKGVSVLIKVMRRG